MWKERKGDQATYNNLIGIFEGAGNQECADSIRHDLTFGKCRSSLVLMQALSLSPTFVYAIGKRVEDDSSDRCCQSRSKERYVFTCTNTVNSVSTLPLSTLLPWAT